MPIYLTHSDPIIKQQCFNEGALASLSMGNIALTDLHFSVIPSALLTTIRLHS